MTKENLGKLKLIAASVIFGTVGLLIKYLGLPSTIVSFTRALVGCLILIAVKYATKKRINFRSIKENLIPLLVAGISIGVNWILLYESYNFTTIAVSSVCNYLAPIFVIILAPLVLKEKLTVKKVVCVFIAFFGLLFVTGVFTPPESNGNGIIGVTMATIAAGFYATLIFANKKLHDIDIYDRTIFQFVCVAIVIGIYNLIKVDFSALTFTPLAVILLLVAAIVHTGIAYIFYFGSINDLPVTTVSILCYIEPVMCVICSAFILHETTEPSAWIGCALIIGAAFVCELPIFEGRKKKQMS